MNKFKVGDKARFTLWYRAQEPDRSLKAATNAATDEMVSAFTLLYPRKFGEDARRQRNRWKRRYQEINE